MPPKQAKSGMFFWIIGKIKRACFGKEIDIGLSVVILFIFDFLVN